MGKSWVSRRWSNLPDNYNMYWRTCHKCGSRYHASDGACDNCIKVAPPPKELTHHKFVWLDTSGEIQQAFKNPEVEYLILGPGKWIVGTDPHRNVVVCAIKHWPESFLREDDHLVEVVLEDNQENR